MLSSPRWRRPQRDTASTPRQASFQFAERFWDGAEKESQGTRTARVPISDEELIGRLQDDAPEVLKATVSEAAFDLRMPFSSDTRHTCDNRNAESPMKNPAISLAPQNYRVK